MATKHILKNTLKVLVTLVLGLQGTAYGLDDVQYFPGSATWSGDGCHFAGDPSGMEDAFFLENGPDLAVIFTNLSGKWMDGATKMERLSRCIFSVPFSIPDHHYIAEYTQTINYGIVKPAGARATLDVDSNLRGAKGNILANLSSIHKAYASKDAVNSPLVSIHSSRDNFAKKSWCKANITNYILQSDLKVGLSKGPKGQEAQITVDGLDARIWLEPTVLPCS